MEAAGSPVHFPPPVPVRIFCYMSHWFADSNQWGRVAEWFKAPVLKTGRGLRSLVGSNPTPSAPLLPSCSALGNPTFFKMISSARFAGVAEVFGLRVTVLDELSLFLHPSAICARFPYDTGDPAGSVFCKTIGPRLKDAENKRPPVRVAKLLLIRLF